MTQVTALILAGGQSSRMGTDKALINLTGMPLLHDICTVALACTPSVKVITPWPERYQAAVPPSVQLIQEQFSATESPQSHGPLVGLAQGLAQIETPWVLALACDLPQLQAATLQRWMGHLDGLPPTALAYLPKVSDRWEPLCGFYRRSCLPPLEAFIQTGGRSFQRWLATQPIEVIPEVESPMFFNLNTPADLDNLRHNLHRS